MSIEWVLIVFLIGIIIGLVVGVQLGRTVVYTYRP